MNNQVIGKIAATEKKPTTIDEFYFWTQKDRILSPFDVIKVEHINESITYGVIEEISHITDSAGYLSSFISSDFGDVGHEPNMHRIGMNFVKARVAGNTKNIYTPALDGKRVSLATKEEISEALGLKNVKHPLPCGYLEMYEGENKVKLPVHFNSKFLIGPEGAHLNISGISGLAAKTSYAMFLLKAIQYKYLNEIEIDRGESVAFVLFNVKGRDLLAIDEKNTELKKADKEIYKQMGLDDVPFQNLKYFYPFSSQHPQTYGTPEDIKVQIDNNTAFKFKYEYERDRENLDLLFSNVEDSTGTMDSIINFILTNQGDFGKIRNWGHFKSEIDKYCAAGGAKGEITVNSWRKFKRIVRKAISNEIFAPRIVKESNETRLEDAVNNIEKNDIMVVDIAKLGEDMQSFVFGDVIRAVYNLKLGLTDGRDEADIPSKIIIFIDELNKYASTDVPKNSPILRQILDITERGRSLGIILFAAEQFKSAIHDRVKGNCATHAYGRTNAIEISKGDYRFVPKVYKNMMTRLEQGEYIIQNPIFRSLLNIKFPHPVYKQYK